MAEARNDRRQALKLAIKEQSDVNSSSVGPRWGGGAGFVTGLLVALIATVTAAAANASSLGCDAQPGGRFFWTERASCDLPWHSPSVAKGIIIWNRGLYGPLEQWRAPVPPVFRLLQSHGWDVIAIRRHNLAEGGGYRARHMAVQRTLEEVRRQREAAEESRAREVSTRP